MKRTIATLIAGLFATAAFAQTPAPTTPAPTAAPASTVSPAVGKAAAEHDKTTTDTKPAKAKSKHKAKKAKPASDGTKTSEQSTVADAGASSINNAHSGSK
jgi:hypothetical protein